MTMLTHREKLIAAFVLGAFLVGFGVKHWRETESAAPLVNAVR